MLISIRNKPQNILMLGSDVRLLNICLLSKKTNKYHLKTDALKWQSVECTHRAYAETPWGAPGSWVESSSLRPTSF